MSECLTDCSQAGIIEQTLAAIKPVPDNEICRRAFKRGVIGLLTFRGMNLEPVVTKVPVRVCGDSNGKISSLAMDFSKPFGIIAQYVGAKLQPAQGTMPWELNKWADYIMRVVFILLTGLVACVTVFIMEAMLVIQKLILVGSKLLVPVWIAALSLPAAKGSAQTFLKFVAGVMCWPIGWALVHVGTMAAFQALQPPSLNASLGELVLAFSTLAIACLWPVVGTIGAPFLIARMVTSGTNFAADMMGSFASVAGQHASRGIQGAAPVAGALMGLGLAGAAGSGVGATLGEAG